MAIQETKEDLKTSPAIETAKAADSCVKAQSAFSLTDVSAAIKAYMATLNEKDKAARIALSTHAPKVEGNVIDLTVDNDFLLTKAMELHPYLLSFLMKKLNNGFITLNVQVYVDAENDEDSKRLFTAKDKFDHFISLNPAVGELKSLFGLELE